MPHTKRSRDDIHLQPLQGSHAADLRGQVQQLVGVQTHARDVSQSAYLSRQMLQLVGVEVQPLQISQCPNLRWQCLQQAL